MAERISELEDIAIETSKWEIQRKTNEKMKQNIQDLWDDYQGCHGNTRRKRKEETEEIFEVLIRDFPQISDRHQTTGVENIKLDNT